MKLIEVFDALAAGELSQLAIVDQTTGVIEEASYPKVINHLNLGLTALYKRFNLKEQRLTFPITQDGNVYRLDVADILKIERIETAEGAELPLNNEADPYSCFTLSMTTVRVPQAIVDQGMDLPEKYKTSELVVVYRANHPKLVMENGEIDPETTEVELPFSYLEALLYFVASRCYNPIGISSEINPGMSWSAKYERECQQLEGQSFDIDATAGNTRLERNGWV
jgi:hypothetical protein